MISKLTNRFNMWIISLMDLNEFMKQLIVFNVRGDFVILKLNRCHFMMKYWYKRESLLSFILLIKHEYVSFEERRLSILLYFVRLYFCYAFYWNENSSGKVGLRSFFHQFIFPAVVGNIIVSSLLYMEKNEKPIFMLLVGFGQ